MRIFLYPQSHLVGEIAILYNVKRTATVITKTVCTLVVLSGEDMTRALSKFPELDILMRKSALNRIRGMQDEYDKMGRSVKIDPSFFTCGAAVLFYNSRTAKLYYKVFFRFL